MRRSPAILILLVFFNSIFLQAQMKDWYVSRIQMELHGGSELGFMKLMEKLMRQSAINAASGNEKGLHVIAGDSPFETPHVLSNDEVVKKLPLVNFPLVDPFSRVFELTSVWNRTGDSCSIISFASTFPDTTWTEKDGKDSSVRKFSVTYRSSYFIPLCEYENFLNPAYLERLRKIVIGQFALSLHAVCSSDTSLEGIETYYPDSSYEHTFAGMKQLVPVICQTIAEQKIPVWHNYSYGYFRMLDSYSPEDITKTFVTKKGVAIAEELSSFSTWGEIEGQPIGINSVYKSFISYHKEVKCYYVYYTSLLKTAYFTIPDLEKTEKQNSIDPILQEEIFCEILFCKMKVVY
jgi:hypothetical protein